MIFAGCRGWLWPGGWSRGLRRSVIPRNGCCQPMGCPDPLTTLALTPLGAEGEGYRKWFVLGFSAQPWLCLCIQVCVCITHTHRILPSPSQGLGCTNTSREALRGCKSQAPEALGLLLLPSRMCVSLVLLHWKVWMKTPLIP